MACTLCGKDVPVDDSGFCTECAEKLRSVSQASSFPFHATAGGGPASPDSRTGESEPAKARSLARVLDRFGGGEPANLRMPFSVAVGPSGGVLVLDIPERSVYRVSLFEADGTYVRMVLKCRKGEDQDQLRFPKGIALDVRGNLYIPDAGNNRIQRFDSQGNCLGSIGQLGQDPGEMDFPCDVEIDEAGALYVADTNNNRVQKLTPQGIALLVIGSDSNGSSPELDGPVGVTVDDAGCIFVVDTNHDRLVKYDPNGGRMLAFGRTGESRGEFMQPSDVRVGPDGKIYVADKDNSRVQVFDSNGHFQSEFSPAEVVALSGVGGDIAIDDDGCLLICDKSTHEVVKVELLDPSPSSEGGSA